jgi:hypothetical protein
MYRRLIAIAIASVSLNAGAAQTLQLVEGAYELLLADVSFPSSIAGNVTFKTCSSCDTQVRPVDSGTEFVGPAGPVSLDEFRAAVAELRSAPNGNQTTAVGVFYNLETNRVTRVSLHPQ